MKHVVRNFTVDIVRTIAILMMVVFHFIYDLRTFAYHDWDIPDGPGWKQWRESIVSLFLLCVGVSLVFSHSNSIRWKKFGLRFISILGAAILISIVTFYSYPENWIYFGILHFIAIASLLSLPLVNMPRLAVLAATGLLLATYFDLVNTRWPYYAFFPGLPWHPHDFVPLVPWLALVWIGIALGHSEWLRRDPLSGFPYRSQLVKPGQHSLAIYLLHQPVIIALMAITAYLFGMGSTPF